MSESRLTTSLNHINSDDKNSLTEFYKLFLESTVYAPERYQSEKLSAQPKYPNDLFYLLGVQAGNDVFIPIFSEPSYIEEWCGQKLNYKTMKALDLLKTVPPEWCVCLNAGSDVEKEFTAWEVSKLAQGPESITEVVEDQINVNHMENLHIRPLEEGEYSKLKSQLESYCKANDLISELYIMIETKSDLENTIPTTLLVAAFFDSLDNNDKQTAYQNELDAICKPHLIGDLNLRTFVIDDPETNITSRLFQQFSPFYTRS
jgi:hypothetical protein